MTIYNSLYDLHEGGYTRYSELISASIKTFGRREWNETLNNTLQLVMCANWINQNQLLHRNSCNPIPFWRRYGQISTDFIDGLPLSYGKSVILVIGNGLCKYIHFISLSHPYSAAQVAHAILENVFKLHGMPSSILCDRDAIFTSSFSWQYLFWLYGSEMLMSSPYDP